MAQTYSYTGGSTANLDRLRFLVGDHRGAAGAFTGTNQLFSDEELNDCLLISTNNLVVAARIATQNRISREALAAGVAGTTDTTDRPQALIAALHCLEQLNYPLAGQENLPQLLITSNATLDARTGDLEDS